MAWHDSVDLISFFLTLIIYPVALSPLALGLFFRRELNTLPAFREIHRLLLFSTLFATASSLQLFFTHLDLLLRLPEQLQGIVFQTLSILVLLGVCFFVLSLPGFFRAFYSLERPPSFMEKVLKALSLTAAVVSSAVLILLLFSALSFLQDLLSFLLPITFIFFIASAVYALALLRRAGENHPPFAPVLIFFGGDLGILLLVLLFPSLLTPILISVFFLFHFWRLYTLLILSKKAETRLPLSEGEKAEHLVKAGLSNRESDIALLLMEGLSYKEVADRCCISLSTVQTHVTRIYGKLGVNNKIGLSKYFKNS